ncbi:hypothetical protein PV761_10775 [Arthrobacter sp. CC3]|uniref:hypothetical protein n=1 Tax=Arthrobacter sp. CC3 TaxID=3029185 RepID=UPI003266AABF
MTRLRRDPAAFAADGERLRISGGMAGLMSAALGIAGGSMEVLLTGPWPTASDAGYAAFLLANRTPVLAQSMLFVFSSAALIWFLGYVRSYLYRKEGGPGTLAGIAFTAGVLGAGLNILGQAAQITLTLPSQAAVAPGVAAAVADLCLVTLALANLPAGVMFTAIAVVSLRMKASPVVLGWIAACAAAASFLSALSLIPESGPLAPMGWLTTLLRLVPLLWYVPAAVLLMRRPV